MSFEKGYGKVKVPHEFHIVFTCWECVFYFGKNALSNLTFPYVEVEIRVATNGALRFSCVVPFGAAHFFYYKNGR